jgi:hypothetical protein
MMIRFKRKKNPLLLREFEVWIPTEGDDRGDQQQLRGVVGPSSLLPPV